MSGTKLHRLLMLALFVLACMALFMLVLEPILGALWILLWSLLGVIFCRKKSADLPRRKETLERRLQQHEG